MFADNYRKNFGYRITHIKKGTPAARANLEPFLDFIVYDPNATKDKTLLFSEFLEESVGKMV